MAKRATRGFSFWGTLFLCSLLLVGAFGSPRGDLRSELEELTAAELERFASSSEFDEWVGRMRQVRRVHVGGGCGGLLLGCAASDAPKDMGAEPDESITNNQEDGVDEGGIVKAAGDYFVILRRGRLFTVRQSGPDGDELEPVAQLDAYPEGWNDGTWYDEMLLYGDRVVVVGFSYEVMATEIGLFRLGEDGSLSHESTYFLRSNDYYSSRNYASRLVDGTLIFYMPYYLFQGGGWGSQEASLPSVMRWVRGNETTEWQPIVPKDEVYRPLQGTLWPTLHTVVRCDLGADELSCQGRAVIGPYARTFYVTRDDVWLWVAPPYEYSRDSSEERIPSYLYRMPIGDGEVEALRAHGVPIDQFSFRASPDGHINVLLRSEGGGDAMWHPEISGGDLALLRAPVELLDASAPEVGPEAYTPLPSNSRWSLHNRFVGDSLLWGASSWGAPEPHLKRVFVTSLAEPERYSDVPLDHQVERIEVLGSAAMVVGGDGEDLFFSAVDLRGKPAVAGTHRLPGAVQGETRSHGFFFRPDSSGGGVLGLPVRYEGASWSHLLYGSAEVSFLRVNQDLALSSLGGLAASAEEAVDDSCVYSCIDWYGNARPIFYRGRTFALMGYELVEGRLDGYELEEIDRINFFLGTPDR